MKEVRTDARNRYGYIDYCKALCIVFVVLLHSGLESLQRIFIFVLPMFFAVSGFLYVPGKRTKKEYITERFRRLIIPFWLLTAMYAPIEAWRSTVLGYGTINNLLTFPLYALYGSSILAPMTRLTEAVSAYAYPYPMAFGKVFIASPSANHLWFLPALFIGSVLFCVLEEKTQKNAMAKILSIGLLLTVAFLDSAVETLRQLPWGIGTGSFCAACMLCGYWAKQARLVERRGGFVLTSVVIGFAFAVLAECLGSTGGAFISSYYGPYGILSVCLTFAGGLGGAWMVLCLMKKLDDTPWTFLKKILSLVGRASMQIYQFHMIFLTLFGYLFLKISGIVPQLDGWLLGFVPIKGAGTVFMIAESLAIVCLITMIVFRKSIKTV